MLVEGVASWEQPEGRSRSSSRPGAAHRVIDAGRSVSEVARELSIGLEAFPVLRGTDHVVGPGIVRQAQGEELGAHAGPSPAAR